MSLENCQGFSIPDGGGKFIPPARNDEGGTTASFVDSALASALDLKPEVTQSCGFESRLRQEVHDCSPGAAQSAAHCSKCVHLDGLNAENTFHSSLYSV